MSLSRKPLVIAMSPLTNTIFAGTLLKDDQTWSSNKQDVTHMALNSVIELVRSRGGAIEMNDRDGNPALRLVVEILQ